MRVEKEVAESEPCREIYSNPVHQMDSAGVPLLTELELLGHARFPIARRKGLKWHRHNGMFEIHYIVDGHLFWHINGQTYPLHPGDVFVTPPSVPHGGEDEVMQPCEFYWLQVRFPEEGQALPGLTLAHTIAIQESLLAASAISAFRSLSGVVLAAFGVLLREHRAAPNGASELEAQNVIAARAALHTLLIQVVRDADACARSRNRLPLSKALLFSMEWMERHLSESFTLEEVAQASSVSVAGLHERFQRELGTTPAEWRMQKRMERAKLWLVHAPEKSVTEIALYVGFGSSQYFATAFKRYTAHTPTEYRMIHK
jgi:AraC-like DNA-binding protein/mannose-6-phosphate isomerase-like protein (cupin superfamily)